VDYSIKNPYFKTPDKKLKYFFTPTKDSYGESSKANFKNHNLPILQHWYNGKPYQPIKCLITKQIGFYNFPDIVTQQDKQRFTCEFNHIRQVQDGGCRSGVSIDKRNYDPSAIVRAVQLDNPSKKIDLLELMTTMTLNKQIHSFVSQDSAKSHITLDNFKQEWWPWGLKKKKNFCKFVEQYNLTDINYDKFIEMLRNINHPSVEVSYKSGLLK
jgi:hypothetical protein